MRDTRDINQLHGWDKNPRTIESTDLERLKRQIERLGIYKPLLITEDGTVLGGNMRLKALKELGKTEVWVSVVDAPTEAKKLEYALSDNDRAGAYNEQALVDLINNTPEINLDDYKVDLGKLTSIEDLLAEYAPDPIEDEVPEVDETQTTSKLGEVYQLGRHRLMCGDSTIKEDLNKLLNGIQPTMLFTDPPYGVDYQSRVDEERRKGWGEIKNDQLKGVELQQFLKDSVGIYGQTKYVCCNWQSVVDFWMALGKPNSFIVWDKESIGLGSGYRNQHELILFYGKLNHNSETNVWSFKRDSTSAYNHPTQKPVGLSARAIKNSSNKSDCILDVFGGSGGTLIACEQLDRTCLMMELDPKYVDVIRKRYAKFVYPDKWEKEWQSLTPAITENKQQ